MVDGDASKSVRPTHRALTSTGRSARSSVGNSTAALAHHGGAATTSPWRRAPFLLIRHPAVFLAILAATAVLAIAASSGVLFLSTLDTASLQTQASLDCPERSMPGSRGSCRRSGQVPDARKTGLRGDERAVTRWARRTPSRSGSRAISPSQSRFYSREGALDHVTKLRGSDGPGVWMPDDYAKKLHLEPGDVFRTNSDFPVRIAGIYRAMYSSPFKLANIPRYFCNWTDLIVRNAVTEGGVGPFLISDEPTIARAADRLAQVEVYDPIPIDSISVDAAEQANRRGRPRVRRLLRERRLLRSTGLGLRGGAQRVDGDAGRDDREGSRQSRRCRRIDSADRHRRRPRRVPAGRGCRRVLGHEPRRGDQAARRARRRLRTARAEGRSGNRAGRDPRARRRNRDCERARARCQPVVDLRTRHDRGRRSGRQPGQPCSASSSSR